MALLVSRFRVETSTAAQTREWGRQTGHLLHPGMVVALYGDLGAGKTTFTQGIAVGLGIQQRVTSPTFVFINEYTTVQGWRLIHIDSYRLPSPHFATTEHSPQSAEFSEADTLGLEDIFSADDAIVVIEWPERIADRLPANHLAIVINSDVVTAGVREADARIIEWIGNGRENQQVVDTLCAGSNKTSTQSP